MSFVTRILQRFRRRYNDDTVETIREARAHARGEIELEEGYIPPGCRPLDDDRNEHP